MAMGTRSRGQAPSTNRPRLSVRSSYEDFKPLIESKEDADAHSVHIHLPGFLKEQIRIVAESNRNMLRVRGERFVSGSTWNRFQEEIAVPENCDITETRAKFEGGVLRITMPKRITAVASETSSPTELSSEAERSPLASPRPALPPNPAPLRPSLPAPSQAAPTPRPLPATEPRPSSLHPTKMPEVTRPENLPPPRAPRTEDLPSQRMPGVVQRPEALPPPRMPEPRMSPSYQPIPSPPQPSRPTPQPPLPHPDATRFTPSIYPKPRENERSRFESSQGPSLPQPPLGLLQALPQPEPAMKYPIASERRRNESDQAPIRNPIGSERWRNESDPAPVRDPIGPERRRIESDPAPVRDPIVSERRRIESDPAPIRDPIVSERRRAESDLAPMRDPIVQERRRIESDPEAMRDPIDLKRRRIEPETPMPLKKPVTGTVADLPGKAPMRYESLTEEEKQRFGMRGTRLRGLEEDRQLLVNMGVAVLVLVSFGAWISYSFGGSSSNQ